MQICKESAGMFQSRPKGRTTTLTWPSILSRGVSSHSVNLKWNWKMRLDIFVIYRNKLYLNLISGGNGGGSDSRHGAAIHLLEGWCFALWLPIHMFKHPSARWLSYKVPNTIENYCLKVGRMEGIILQVPWCEYISDRQHIFVVFTTLSHSGSQFKSQRGSSCFLHGSVGFLQVIYLPPAVHKHTC